MPRDQIFVQSLQLDASVGVFEWEKKIRQSLIFDLELFTDFRIAAQSDAIADAVDYAAVCEQIKQVLAMDHYQLLERLAEVIVQTLFEQFSVERIVLSVHKPGAVPNTQSVGVKVDRSRSG